MTLLARFSRVFFTKCYTPLSETHSLPSVSFFAESIFSGTQQTSCLANVFLKILKQYSAKIPFADCFQKYTRQTEVFVECFFTPDKQSCLPSVFLHSANKVTLPCVMSFAMAKYRVLPTYRRDTGSLLCAIKRTTDQQLVCHVPNKGTRQTTNHCRVPNKGTRQNNVFAKCGL